LAGIARSTAGAAKAPTSARREIANCDCEFEEMSFGM
jgi:hypothetical protein